MLHIASMICLPTDFIFVGAANPCRCGRLFEGGCTCTPGQVRSVMSRISKPILDRIDLQVPMKRISHNDLDSSIPQEGSSVIRQRIINVRRFQFERYRKKNILNAHLEGPDREKYCKLDSKSKELLRLATDSMGLSARGYDKVIKIARTIADMEFSDSININHVAEAVQYRALDSLMSENK